MENSKNVTRIHLKTGGKEGAVDRKKLIEFCLHNQDEQYVVIGWSHVYKNNTEIHTFSEYYKAIQDENKRINPAINRFAETQENDLFWTRDLDGFYWICRAKGPVELLRIDDLDIGSAIPVEAYKYGKSVPGQIAASFSRARGGITERFWDKKIIAFSQYAFNMVSSRQIYDYEIFDDGDFLDNLPPFDLEELVISYLQIVEGYYVLSNSIAQKSTTIKIECELYSRDINDIKKAVVQVKGRDKDIDALDYLQYEKEGYIVYLFAPVVKNIDKLKNGIWISRETILNFFNEYKAILPNSITKWENIFNSTLN